MDTKCEIYNRCIRCRKLNFKRETTLYQHMRKDLFEKGLRDSCGNLIVCESFIQSLLNQRAKLGRLARGIENARRKIKQEREPLIRTYPSCDTKPKEVQMGCLGVGEDEVC